MRASRRSARARCSLRSQATPPASCGRELESSTRDARERERERERERLSSGTLCQERPNTQSRARAVARSRDVCPKRLARKTFCSLQNLSSISRNFARDRKTRAYSLSLSLSLSLVERGREISRAVFSQAPGGANPASLRGLRGQPPAASSDCETRVVGGVARSSRACPSTECRSKPHLDAACVVPHSKRARATIRRTGVSRS